MIGGSTGLTEIKVQTPWTKSSTDTDNAGHINENLHKF